VILLLPNIPLAPAAERSVADGARDETMRRGVDGEAHVPRAAREEDSSPQTLLLTIPPSVLGRADQIIE
jgi:hypothetical protein